MSDRIAVMSEGHVEQVGTPEEIYDCPATVFVAGFIGTANLLPGTVEERRGERVTFGWRVVAGSRPRRRPRPSPQESPSWSWCGRSAFSSGSASRRQTGIDFRHARRADLPRPGDSLPFAGLCRYGAGRTHSARSASARCGARRDLVVAWDTSACCLLAPKATPVSGEAS